MSLICLAIANSVSGAPVVVSSFPGAPGWSSSTTGTGTVGIVDASGVGGGGPLPTGAVHMTTGFSNNDRASIALSGGGLGGVTAQSLISGNFNVSYSYFQSTLAGGNTAAAPALRLSFFNPGFMGDGFVTLIYEPYWNQASNPGAPVDPPADQWVTVNVTPTSGLFWQNGGFGQVSSAGGPPFNTLSGWGSTFDPAFSNAILTSIEFGIGSFNQGKDTYLDNVTISLNGNSTTYDFQLAATPVPEPASLVVWGMIGAMGAAAGWRKRQRAKSA